MEIDPKSNYYKDNYKLLIGSVVPRPIAFVSSVAANGEYNLAPFSFFNAICSNPPSLMFAPVNSREDASHKDTLNNILETEEFVVNVVTEDIAEQMNICATDFPPGYDEFKESGLTPIESTIVKAPRVKESPINFECRLMQHVPVGNPKDPGSGNVVIGEVVNFHIADDLYYEGKIDIRKLKPIGRLAGSGYTRVTDLFEMDRIPFKSKK